MRALKYECIPSDQACHLSVAVAALHVAVSLFVKFFHLICCSNSFGKHGDIKKTFICSLMWTRISASNQKSCQCRCLNNL